jgi:hypothetical protein
MTRGSSQPTKQTGRVVLFRLTGLSAHESIAPPRPTFPDVGCSASQIGAPWSGRHSHLRKFARSGYQGGDFALIVQAHVKLVQATTEAVLAQDDKSRTATKGVQERSGRYGFGNLEQEVAPIR